MHRESMDNSICRETPTTAMVAFDSVLDNFVVYSFLPFVIAAIVAITNE